MQEVQVWSPDLEDPLEEEMATHSSILTWKIPWMEESGGLQSMVSQKNWIQLSNSTIATEVVLIWKMRMFCWVCQVMTSMLHPFSSIPASLSFPSGNTSFLKTFPVLFMFSCCYCLVAKSHLTLCNLMTTQITILLIIWVKANASRSWKFCFVMVVVTQMIHGMLLFIFGLSLK